MMKFAKRKQTTSTCLDKQEYFTKPAVRFFTEYMSKILTGEIAINHSYKISRGAKFSDELVHLKVLEDGYKTYLWSGYSFDETAKKLEEIRFEFNLNAIDASAEQIIYLNAIDKCLVWGLGRGGPYKDNICWAKQRMTQLPERIKLGVRLLDSDSPDLSPFADEVRMNAGYTKVFSLLCKNSIIYDGRVGAALGYLVSLFLSGIDEDLRDEYFLELSFPYGRGRGKNARNRNPSTPQWTFPALGQDSLEHAKWNLKASWIIRSAIESASRNGSLWVSAGDGLRRVEAALFMVGYQVPSSR
jgi:hypothetical protein